SRRRHTRFSRDWSSDVCSSDLLFTQCDQLVVALSLVRSAPCPEGSQGGRLRVQLAVVPTTVRVPGGLCALLLDVLLLAVHLREDLVGEAARYLTGDAFGDRPAGQAHAGTVLVHHRVTAERGGVHADGRRCLVESAQFQNSRVCHPSAEAQPVLRPDEPEDQPRGLEIRAAAYVA